MPKPYPTQTLVEIRRARERCPTYNPRLPTRSAARFAKLTPGQLRHRHRALAIKIDRCLSWFWSDIERLADARAAAESFGLPVKEYGPPEAFGRKPKPATSFDGYRPPASTISAFWHVLALG
jgi:hypothetical protein